MGILKIKNETTNEWQEVLALKGDQGPIGNTGSPAGFGTPTASATQLEPNAEPTVTVEASGEDTSKIFNFVFGIPKGAKGDTGEKGAQGDPGIQGEQGPAGPNEITTETQTNLTGLLKGNGTNVQLAEAGTDYQAPIVETTATLVATDWVVGDYSITQAVSVDGVRLNNKVIISPNINSMEEYLRTGIYCAKQTYNALTFQSTVTTPPTNDLIINVLIMG